MASAQNQHNLHWTNPTTYTDGSPFDATTKTAGYTIQLDGTGAVSIPLAFGTSFDLATLAAYQALKRGSHTVALSIVDKDGGVSDYSTAATFQVNVAPSAPSAVSVT